MAEHPRLIGIDLIGAVYLLAALLMILLLGSSAGATRIIFNFLVPISVAVSVGMFARIKAIRIMLLVLLILGMIADAYLAVLYFGGGVGIFDTPEDIDPWQKLFQLPFRLAIAIWIFTYLQRSDVKAAFEEK